MSGTPDPAAPAPPPRPVAPPPPPPVERAADVARPFLADFLFLILAGGTLLAVEGKLLLLAHPPARATALVFTAALALVLTAAHLLCKAMAYRRLFREPRAALWFLPFLHLMLAYPLLHAALALPPALTHPQFWSEATGLDLTRFQQLAGLFLTLLALNSFVSLAPAVGLYFRCHMIEQVDRLIDAPPARAPIGSGRPAILFLLAALALLVTHITVVRPDHYGWWKVRLEWRLLRDARRTVRAAERFLADHPESPLRENALFTVAHRSSAAGPAQRDPARRAAERLLADHPESLYAPEATLLLARLLLDDGAAEPARDLADAFAAAHPAHPLADDLLALAARAAGRLGDASGAAERRARLANRYPDGVTFACDAFDRIVAIRPTTAAEEDPGERPAP